MFNTNLQSTVWKRHVGSLRSLAVLLGLNACKSIKPPSYAGYHVGAHAVGHQHGGRKSMKTSGIHFCYKRQLDHSHEQANIHINTFRKTSTVQIVKNRKMRHFFSIRDSLRAAILMSRGVKFRNSKWSILKTAAAIELKTSDKIYIKDV